MGKTISRYELGCDLFMNLCYLYDCGCCHTLRDRWIHFVFCSYTPDESLDALGSLLEIQNLINTTERWKQEIIEIDE